MTENATQQTDAVEESAALKRLRQAVDAQRDLPSINDAPQRLASLAGRDQIRIQDLTELVFADPALALRLIRVANGSAYGNRDRTDVVQATRALTLLGLEQTRSEARRLVKLEERVPPNRRDMVRDSIGYATFASRFARTLLDTRNPVVSEEGAVCALLANLPEIVFSLHAPHELAALRYVRRHYPNQLEVVNRELIGPSGAEIRAEIVQRWALPRSPLETINRTTGRPTPAVAGRDWLALGVGLSISVTRSLKHAEPNDRANALQKTLRRYSPAMSIDKGRLDALIETVAHEALGLERSLGSGADTAVLSRLLTPHLRRESFEPGYWSSLEKLDATGAISRLKNRSAMISLGARSDDAPLNPVGKPLDGSVRLKGLLEELRDTVQTYLQGERDGEFAQLTNTPYERVRMRMVPLILRGILECLGYDKVVWFEHRPENEDWPPTAAAGVRVDTLQGLARTRIAPKDLFGVVLANGADVHIADCTAPKIAQNMPNWFRVLFPNARSFLLVPVKIAGSPVGFIMADRACTDPMGLTEQELAITRELRDELAALLERFPNKRP